MAKAAEREHNHGKDKGVGTPPTDPGDGDGTDPGNGTNPGDGTDPDGETILMTEPIRMLAERQILCLAVGSPLRSSGEGTPPTESEDVETPAQPGEVTTPAEPEEDAVLPTEPEL